MKEYLIWSGHQRQWWGPNRSGYTLDITQAGRYSQEEAQAIVRGTGPDRKNYLVDVVESGGGRG